MKFLDKEINIQLLKEIKGFEVKIIKRKLTIYNFLNNTNYSLEDVGIDEYLYRGTNPPNTYFFGTKISPDITLNGYAKHIVKFKRAITYLENEFNKGVFQEKTSKIEIVRNAMKLAYKEIPTNWYIINSDYSNYLIDECNYAGYEADYICNRFLKYFYEKNGY